MNVLLAIDGSTCSEAAVSAVMSQFRPNDTDVRVVHVIEWPLDFPASVAFGAGSPGAEHVLTFHEELRRRGRDLVGGAAARLQSVQLKATPHVLEGDAREAILGMAAAWPADLIVVGSHGRRGVDRFLLGSVSERLVRHATCTVQVVRERSTATGPHAPGHR